MLVITAHWGWSQTYSLAEPIKKDDCFQIRLEMSLSGKMRIYKDGKPTDLNLSATASHQFPERILNIGSSGLPDKTIRHYEAAKATITAGGDTSLRTLSKEHQCIVAQRAKDLLLIYSPHGSLTREELELTNEHFDTLAVTGLLPGKSVAVGETWTPGNSVVQYLCNFEGLMEQNLVCKLEEVKDKVAHVAVSGTAIGIEMGAQVKVTIKKASYHFDLSSNRLTWLEWETTDERDQGPVNPASSVESTTILKREAMDTSDPVLNVEWTKVPPKAIPLRRCSSCIIMIRRAASIFSTTGIGRLSGKPRIISCCVSWIAASLWPRPPSLPGRKPPKALT